MIDGNALKSYKLKRCTKHYRYEDSKHEACRQRCEIPSALMPLTLVVTPVVFKQLWLLVNLKRTKLYRKTTMHTDERYAFAWRKCLMKRNFDEQI